MTGSVEGFNPPNNPGHSNSFRDASSTPSATYQLNTAAAVPGTRPARLILRPYEYNSTGQHSTSSGEQPQPEYMRFYNVAEDVSPRKHAVLSSSYRGMSQQEGFQSNEQRGEFARRDFPSNNPDKFVSMQPTQEFTPPAHWHASREHVLPASYKIPPPLLENKYPKEQALLKSWNEVDHAGAVATCRLERVPLPLLERVEGGSPKFHMKGPLVRIRLPQAPSVDGDFRRFCQRIATAFNGAADDCRRLFLPCTQLQLPNFECCKPQSPIQQECKSCGFKGHFCPECGTGQNGEGMTVHGTGHARIPTTRGVLGELSPLEPAIAEGKHFGSHRCLQHPTAVLSLLRTPEYSWFKLCVDGRAKRRCQ